jgi:hypothetical protein
MAFTDHMFQLGMGLTMQYNDRFVEMTAPDYWACYFIYGDPGDMTDEEMLRADSFIEENDIIGVIDIVEGSDRFTWQYDLYDPGACVSGGTVVDYIVEVKIKETSNV